MGINIIEEWPFMVGNVENEAMQAPSTATVDCDSSLIDGNALLLERKDSEVLMENREL